MMMMMITSQFGQLGLWAALFRGARRIVHINRVCTHIPPCLRSRDILVEDWEIVRNDQRASSMPK
jgi:hypothetical protein